MSEQEMSKNVPFSESKKEKLSRNKQVMEDIKLGLKYSVIAKRYNISVKTVYRIYRTYLEEGFVFDAFSDFIKLKTQVKPEIAFQGVTKIITKYYEDKNKQSPTVNVNVNNNLPDQLKVQINELIQVGEETCNNHPNNQQSENLLHSSDIKLVEDNKA